MEVAELNKLRISVRSIWEIPGQRPTPLIHLVDETKNHDEALDAFKTIASELGVRHIRIDLTNGLTDEHRATLKRPAPRIVILTAIEESPPEGRGSLHDDLCANARTLPIVVGFLPADKIETIHRGWPIIRAGRAAEMQD